MQSIFREKHFRVFIILVKLQLLPWAPQVFKSQVNFLFPGMVNHLDLPLWRLCFFFARMDLRYKIRFSWKSRSFTCSSWDCSSVLVCLRVPSSSPSRCLRLGHHQIWWNAEYAGMYVQIFGMVTKERPVPVISLS